MRQNGTATGIAWTDGVQRVTATADLARVQIFRSDRLPAYWTGELEVRATEPNLLATLDSQVAIGVFPNEATARYLVAVLGHDAAIELGIDRVEAGSRVAGHATSWTP